MKTIVYLAGLSTIALSLGLAQGAQPNRQAAGEPQGRLLQRLNLTETQRKDIEKLRFDMRKSSIDREAQLKTDRLELGELFRAENPDPSAVEKKINEISQVQTQNRLAAVRQWFAINKLLTPDQQKTWKRALGQFIRNRRAFAARARRNATMQRPFGRQGFRQMPSRNGTGR